jgi:hypothetical protein
MAPSKRPPLLTVLAALVAIEALGVSAYAAWFGTQLFVAPTASLAGAVFLLALFVLMAVWLWALTIGLIRMRTWTRSGALVWQTIQVVVGVSMMSAEGGWVAVAVVLIVLGLIAGALIFTPRVMKAISRQRD